MATPKGENSSVDLNRFNEVFFEECAENLAEMEQILISLGDREPDHEQMNAIFRAAHSIKGGAGIFGFQDMTVVTHVMESLLDRLRNQEIPFTPGMIDLFLEAGDAIAMQLAWHREGKAVDQEAIDRVRARLQQVTDTGAHDQEVAPGTGQEASATQEEEFLPRRCRLAFTPDPEIFARGIRMESIISELTDLAEPGEFTCAAQLMDTPDLAELDPERCITRWDFSLLTRASRDQLLDVFMFVADEEQLHIEEELVDRRAPAGEPAPEQPLLPSPGRRAYDGNETAPGAFGRRGSETESSIRVNVTKVDQLVNQIGELLITQAMLSQIAVGLDPILHQTLQRGLAQLERNTRDLQGTVMSIRLVPISIVFNRFPRLVRETAAKLGKQVELKTTGDSTELDRGLIEKIADPLGHLVRNALDHGLETPERRAACGKSPVGTLLLSASQVGGRIVIDVTDDGAGLNRERILEKALECGIPCSESMSDEEVWQLIFAPGFSTASEVTDLSGRGVGMDVVIKNVQAIGGRVQIVSEAGRGARFTISLPLTLAILEGLSVAVGEEKFIIPLNMVIESLQPKAGQLKSVNGREVVQVRGEYLPIIKLHRIFNLEAEVSEPQRGIVVLVEADGERGGILVDALLDEQQVVVKSIETNYRRVEGSAGATILGDGRVALILDLPELFAMHKRL
ncbi:chemotaxis protein CheW [Geomonas subterranea]|uniref:Chemotaxis protein CheW n=1 Tax=Geomonas subterranea TaxID=2847989 RepID=A0ABX8LMU9_9BACT|nr:chemotaxis protein CheW [Geomonas subterranea]QXE90870.1 chemotaxis protein CheW [Geomonas subterranea]QXM11618.1 chemotaxis protein CheW [Geomonas subterranea]